MKESASRGLFVGLLLLMVVGCSQTSPTPGPVYGTASEVGRPPEYSFAPHPLHNPRKLSEAYQPLIQYLNNRLSAARLSLEASRDYGAFEEKCRQRGPHFLLPNPWQTLQAEKAGYHVMAMAGDRADFYGILLVRKDCALRTPSDLKGRAVSYPAPTALAACIMPQFFLHDHGIDVTRDIENRYVGSQESSIMNVYLGQTSAGATWAPPWRAFQREHPKEAADLRVMWKTEPLVNNSVMARDDVPAPLRERIRALLTGLHETAEGKAILAGMETARFHNAEDIDYDEVRTYVERFEREVRRVESH